MNEIQKSYYDAALQIYSEFSLLENHIEANWRIRQNNILDNRTIFVYKCNTYQELQAHFRYSNLTVIEINYASHRWRNLRRHDAWMYLLFSMIEGVTPNPVKRDSKCDFFLDHGGDKKPFDLKLTRYPKSAPPDLSDNDLAMWLYQNQSKQSRFHLNNRFFVIGQPEQALYIESSTRNTLSNFVKSAEFNIIKIFFSDSQSANSIVLRQKI